MLWMQEKESNQAAMHIYQLDVTSPSSTDPIYYCTIIEIHSPQYLTVEYLRAIYSDQFFSFSERTEEIDALLQRVTTLIESFPRPSF